MILDSCTHAPKRADSGFWVARLSEFAGGSPAADSAVEQRPTTVDVVHQSGSAYDCSTVPSNAVIRKGEL